MTNHPIDFKNSDAFLICGNNVAENHPLSMRWIVEAMEKRGAPLIVVDPRFNRTASMATHFLRIRPGTDIAFFGGLFRYIIDKGLFPREYVTEYTNAGFIVAREFETATDRDGVFPGLMLDLLEGGKVAVSDGKAEGVDWSNVREGGYDKSAWKYESVDRLAGARAEGGDVEVWGNVLVDRSLSHPRSVLQLMRRHYDRYTPEQVSAVTGAPVEELVRIWDVWIEHAGPAEKAGGIMYAMGQTQSTNGVQKIRTLCMAQLLLGNIGLSGGGVNAHRGHAQVQGATDNPTLYHILPGYLKPPTAAQQDWATYLRETTPPRVGPEGESLNWWGHTPKYAVSLWKAWWRDEFDHTTGKGYELMPKLEPGAAYGFIDIFHAMHDGVIEGLYLMGQNPAVGGPNARQNRIAMRKLKWMVVSDFYETESAAIWKPESDDGVNPEEIATEVFLLPAAGPYEKQGSFTHTGRWMQWRDKAVDPYGESLSDAHIINELYWEMKELYEREGGAYPDPLLKLSWDYTSRGPYERTLHRTHELDEEAVAREINGYALEDVTDPRTGVTIRAGQQLPMFTWYRDDGSTAGGNWLYAGYYTESGNMARRRDGHTDPTGKGLYSNWGFNWPANRRILYNRAGSDPRGRPWNPEHAAVLWDGSRWVGDVVDGGGPPGAIKPFIMRNEGVGRFFGFGLKDAPFPEHYEPFESPVRNVLSSMQNNPCVKRWDNIHPDISPIAAWGTRYTKDFPYVLSTWRVVEHHLSGQMSRNARWLAQLQPELFVELSPELAEIERVSENDLVVVESRRGRIVARARITRKQGPLTVAGQTVHMIGMPFHWGYKGYVTGHVTNDTMIDLNDPNVQIQESKHLLVRLDKPNADDMARFETILAQAGYRNGKEV